jgi:hypothetical protein
MRSPCSLCGCVSPLLNLRISESAFMKLRVYVMALEPISMVRLIDPSHQSVSLYMYPPIVARQQLSKTLPWQQIHMQQ